MGRGVGGESDQAMDRQMQGNFSAAEERQLWERLAQGSQPSCPRCDGALDLTPVGPRPDVGYVRNRLLIQCSACKLRGVVDR
jgi:hypothetical protein